MMNGRKALMQGGKRNQAVCENVEMRSNGESAMRYFVDHITENAVYLLDEPENSLSVAMQQELCRFINMV